MSSNRHAYPTLTMGKQTDCSIFTRYYHPKDFNASLMKKADSLLMFYLSKILRRKKENLFIDVKFRKNGYGLEHKYGQTAELLNNEFEVLIDASLPEKHLLITLQHELIHVKQYFLGELLETETACRERWKGSIVDCSQVKYYDLPWERQAFALESRYYNQWKRWYEEKGFQEEV